MTEYQVTALFGNIYEIVGADTMYAATAEKVFTKYANTGRAVRLHVIIGSSSRVIKEANTGA